MSQVAHARGEATRFPLVRNTSRTSSAHRNDNKRGTKPAVRVSAEQGDAQLVAAARSGVNDAFDALVRLYESRILSIAWKFTHKREDSEDVAQQAFQKAFLHIHEFQGNSSFATWLTRIAINEGLMWLRRRRASAEVSLEALHANADMSMQLDPTDRSPNPEEAYLQLETQQIVSTALGRLSGRLRGAIQLRELGEMSTEEAAEVLGVPVGTIKARVFQGRKKLRSILKHHMGIRVAQRAGFTSNQRAFVYG